jgi:hypothetical protein
MQLINYSSEKFAVASERTEGIPEHAVEIQGDLIEIDKRNLMKWGIKSSAVDRILAAGMNLPVRICNNKDPHACDYVHDHSSDVGYVTKIWQDGDWIKASAAITDREAAKKLNDGTWMRAGIGKWSVAGYPGPDVNNDGMLSDFAPASISFVIPPNKPAYEGSKFEMVVAAVDENKTKLQSEHDKNTIGDNMADNDGDAGKTEPKKEVEPKTEEPKTEPKAGATIQTEPPITTKEEATMYSQDEFDKKLSESLETQKAEYNEQMGKMQQEMAQMTPNGDLESMLSAAKKETVEATIDQITREKLIDEYTVMLTASVVLKAPFETSGKLDEEKLKVHIDEMRTMATAAIKTKIDHSRIMAAAVPSETAFDATKVKVGGDEQKPTITGIYIPGKGYDT